MRAEIPADPVDRERFPTDVWRLVERYPGLGDDLGLTETLFAVSNGYLGVRATPEEGRPTVSYGTYINGFHEIWPIRHAEAAYGFARTGQTLVNVPDATVLKVYVDDEPLILGSSDIEAYERSMDFRDGVLRRRLIWRTPGGQRVQVDTTRCVSMTERHLAVFTIELTMLEGSAPIAITSSLINRQDGTDEYTAPPVTRGDSGTVQDPRKAGGFDERVMLPRLSRAHGERLALGFEANRSQMTVAAVADHVVKAPADASTTTHASADQARWTIQCSASAGDTIRVDKFVAYHSSRGVDPGELADRCDRTLQRAVATGREAIHETQRVWYDAFWDRSDVVVTEHADACGRLDGDPVALQQAIRFNLFSIAQATARSDGQGVAAKGVTGSGYEGHYFWDTEIYVMPFLTFTSPDLARNVLQFRVHMLPQARARAAEMAIQGAQYPWRTINGEEASAYYAAGTAQVHIDADISYAMVKYAQAAGDDVFLHVGGLDVLVETARLWADIGFVRDNGDPSFQIHGVTGPDEYTTVVNNNLFTNVMARYNLEQAVAVLTSLRHDDVDEYNLAMERLNIGEDEIERWAACAVGMRIPYDEELGIHPQDDFFLHREVWDLESTPPELHPLLLHYHPLVIYRFQVLKQADVVLALFLQGDRFTAEEKLRDFEYYTPITTGDSTLSAVVEAIVAAEVGHHRAAREFFHEALYCDLANLHANSADGIHIASAGGVWAALVNGFAGMRQYDDGLHFDPRLPVGWETLGFPLQWRGHLLQVEVSPEAISFTSRSEDAEAVGMHVRGQAVRLDAGGVVRVPLDGHGERIDRPLIAPPKGRRPDGTRLAAHLPPPIPEPLTYLHDTGSMPVIRDPDEGRTLG